MKVKLTLALILVLLLGPSACVLFSDCDEGKPYFVIEGLAASNLKTGSRYVQPNEAVQWDMYTLRVEFEQKFISKMRDPMGTLAMALKPCDPNGYKGTKVGLDTLYVISETNYNDLVQMGDTVNNLIRAGAIYQGLDELSYFVADSKTNLRENGIDFQLTEPPSNQNKNCRFKVSIILKDGSKFQASSPDVTLTR